MADLSKVSTEHSYNPLLNIISFVFSLAASTFIIYHVDEVWFYATHGRKSLQNTSCLIGSVIIIAALMVLRSKWQPKTKEAVALSLLGTLLGLVVVVSYALLIWSASGRGG